MERAPTDTKDVPCGEAGPHLSFDEIEIGKKRYRRNSRG